MTNELKEFEKQAAICAYVLISALTIVVYCVFSSCKNKLILYGFSALLVIAVYLLIMQILFWQIG